MSQTNLRDLLPPEAGLSFWQRCVRNAILNIQDNRTPYDPKWGASQDPPHSGSLMDRRHGGGRIMRGGNPPLSYCCGAVMEAFMLAWKEWMVGYEEDDISHAQMQEIYAHFFVFTRDDKSTAGGAMSGLKWLAGQVDWLTVSSSLAPDTFPFGTFLQMRFGPDPYKDGGHSAIVIGHGTKDGRPVLVVWSSNYGFKARISRNLDGSFTVVDTQNPTQAGHGADYYLKDKVYSSGFRRMFQGAWIVDDEY